MQNSKPCNKLSLYPFQKTGVRRLIQGSCLLLDEPGLGKTVQVCVALRYLKPKRILIVCPLTLIPVWQQHLDTWWPGSNFQAHTGHRQVTNYEQRPTGRYDVLVLDEIHKCKNRKALRSRHFRSLARKSEITWGLSGTLFMNRADDGWCPLNMIAPKQFNSYWQFATEWCKTQKSRWSASGIEILPGIKQGMEKDFANILKPYVLRRTKSEVGIELPSLTRQVIELDMTSEQRRIHDELLSQLKVEIAEGKDLTVLNVLARTVHMRRCCVSPTILGSNDIGAKFKALGEFLDGFTRVVVFSQWSTPLKTCHIDDDEKLILYGDLTGTRRLTTLQSWRDGNSNALFATIGVGGVGLTLTEADTCIFLDESWNPADNEQAECRLHRVGQTKPVNSIILRCKNSIEDTVAKALGDKTRMIELINEYLKHH